MISSKSNLSPLDVAEEESYAGVSGRIRLLDRSPLWSTIDSGEDFAALGKGLAFYQMLTGTQPKGLLLDYGGTLVEETSFDPRAGNELLFSRAVYRPEHVGLEQVLDRASHVSTEVAARRDEFQLETPWPTLTRLIYDFLGIRFSDQITDLELAFWKASVRTKPMPGAREAIEEFHRYGVPIGVVSNSSFGQHVIRYELNKYGLADCLLFIMVSAEYAVRKPNTLLFETAAAKLGVESKDIWFVGDRLDTDMAGAKAAGMKAIWFDPGNSRPPTSGVDLRVAHWEDLLDCFRQTLEQAHPPALGPTASNH